MGETEDAIQKRKKAQKKNRTVAYSIDGRAIRGKLSKGKKSALITACILLLLVLAIYIPPMFYKESDTNTSVPIIPDADAVKTCQAYLKDNPDEDFDGDGLNNSIEEDYGTDPWDTDTDGDGVSDYAELYITETSPTQASSALVRQVKADDEENGDSLSTPYKIDDIIFWPDSYSDKAYGTVVRTVRGYRFCNYSGWIRFPETVYAYRYDNGIHYELEYRENEDAWRIDSSDEVLLYASPLEFKHCLTLPFVGTIYLDDEWLGQTLTKLLPDRGGILTCYKASTIDLGSSETSAVTATLRSPLINRDDITRFGRNMNSLEDLSWVRKLLEANECVAVSLYSSTAGESIGIVYGYTETGDLLVADESLNPVGTLYVTECADNLLSQDGEIAQDSWFEFKGGGFDSVKYGNRISFFASTLTDSSDGEDTAGQEAVMAETSAPETEMPETAAPETSASETAVPETMAPETVAPETVDPETVDPVASDTMAPETTVPETTAPETAAAP